MTYKFDGYNWLVRLERGELLMENLTSLVKEQKIGGAWVSGLGGATWAELGFYSLETKDYIWKKLEQALEITSLQGNVARDGEEPVIHLHGTFSDKDMQAYGGHVKELEVAGTCEILLHRWYEPGLKRTQDDQTGLKLLDL
ncbi:MAG TPA: PPC domain-containing DNA-binding protein [Patescibacteria group bacterium]|nr:PPC domain-containing DNA-binding protein [Patescibacteria group bacterium]